ncbi:unnamed protein product [Ilex paraguariensis]|uniref:BED-type domain-containing protein n=1 Tax=Ilex paraguariensis TaxID=185542 RepID=A0ABC8S720_9AQUA
MTKIHIEAFMSSRDNIREDNVDYGEESSVAKKRGRKSRSIVWDIFEKLPVKSEGRQKTRCKKCDQLYMADLKSGTSNLKRHLKTCCFEHDTNELEP